MLAKLKDLQTEIHTSSLKLMDTQKVDQDELVIIKEKGLTLVDQLDRVIDDEIIDDTQSLRLKLEGLFPENETVAFDVLSTLISMSDKVENIKVYFEDED